MAGYEDLDSLVNQQNTLLQQQEQKQNDIINQQTQMQVDELNREKEKLEKETDKTTQGLYANWQKQSNQYGAGMEQLAEQGLANSGYAESTKTALYNTYQKSVTDTLNHSKDLYADYNFKIQQARQNGSIQQAQSALELYAQRVQLLTQNYQLRQNREQFLYQQDRDKVSDSQWQKTFDEQVRQNELENQWKQKQYDLDSYWKQKQYDYQKQRDSVADSQWQQQFALSKKKSSSGSSGKKSSSEKLNVSGSSISDYAVNTANNLKSIQNQGGKINSAILNQSKGIISDKVNKGELSVEEAEYIYGRLGW